MKSGVVGGLVGAFTVLIGLVAFIKADEHRVTQKRGKVAVRQDDAARLTRDVYQGLRALDQLSQLHTAKFARADEQRCQRNVGEDRS